MPAILRLGLEERYFREKAAQVRYQYEFIEFEVSTQRREVSGIVQTTNKGTPA